MTRPTPIRAILALTLLAIGWCGCAGGGGEASSTPLADLSDPALGRQDRIRAIEASRAEVESGALDRTVWRDTVKKVAWGAANRFEVRIAAIDALLADDEADTRNMLRLMLPREPDWAVMGRICDLASENGWTDFTPALVRSWSRPVLQPTDPERPERAALAALHPGVEVEETVFRVFATPSDDALFGDKQREEAWALLCRLDPTGSGAARRLASLGPMDDPLLVDLQTGARDLRASPTTPEQLQWLRELRKPEHAPWWSESSRVIAGLGPEQLDGFQLRHAAAVLWASEHESRWLGASRTQLISEVTDRLSGRETHQRTAESVEGVKPRGEQLDHNISNLVWGDALLVLIADRALREEAVAADLFEQADTDRGDGTTEHGGVLDSRADAFVVLHYPPRPAQRVGDNRFVASPELLERGATALFHYHFHARKADESNYAGPGPGDAEYADRFGRSCLVATSISEDVLDVDYYQPGGAIVDLGEVLRP